MKDNLFFESILFNGNNIQYKIEKIIKDKSYNIVNYSSYETMIHNVMQNIDNSVYEQFKSINQI